MCGVSVIQDENIIELCRTQHAYSLSILLKICLKGGFHVHIYIYMSVCACVCVQLC